MMTMETSRCDSFYELAEIQFLTRESLCVTLTRVTLQIDAQFGTPSVLGEAFAPPMSLFSFTQAPINIPRPGAPLAL